MKPGSGNSSQSRGAEIHDQAVLLLIDHPDIERIVGLPFFALNADTGFNVCRGSEESGCLINEVRAEIKERATAGSAAFAPDSAARLRAEAVKVRRIADDAAQFAAGDDLLHRLEVAIPAAVLISAEQQVARARHIDKPGCFIRG